MGKDYNCLIVFRILSFSLSLSWATPTSPLLTLSLSLLSSLKKDLSFFPLYLRSILDPSVSTRPFESSTGGKLSCTGLQPGRLAMNLATNSMSDLRIKKKKKKRKGGEVEVGGVGGDSVF